MVSILFCVIVDPLILLVIASFSIYILYMMFL